MNGCIGEDTFGVNQVHIKAWQASAIMAFMLLSIYRQQTWKYFFHLKVVRLDKKYIVSALVATCSRSLLHFYPIFINNAIPDCF